MQPAKLCAILDFDAGMPPQRLRLEWFSSWRLLDWSGVGADSQVGGVLLRKSLSSLLTNIRDYDKPEKPVLTCVRNSGGGKGGIVPGLGIPQVGTCAKRSWPDWWPVLNFSATTDIVLGLDL